MRLRTFYTRFFRSFNFDYLRKSREDSTATPDPWDVVGGACRVSMPRRCDTHPACPTCELRCQVS